MITTTIFLSILGQKRAVFLDVPPEQRHFAPEEKFVVAKWYIWQKCNYDSIHRHLKYFNQCIFYCYKLSNWTFWAEEFIFFIKSCHQLNLKDSKASDHLCYTYLCDHRSTWNDPMFQNYYNFPLFTETLMLVSSSNR